MPAGLKRLPRPRGGLLAALVLALLASVLAVWAVASDDGGTDAAVDPVELPAGRLPVVFDPGGFSYQKALREETLTNARELGIDTLRVIVPWYLAVPDGPPADATDPADPAYDFADLDQLLQLIDERGFRTLVTVTGPAPGWATFGEFRKGPPDADRFGELLRAVGRRYGGGFDPPGGEGPLPAADLWSIWDLPNSRGTLVPQFRDGEPYSPLIYRSLALAAIDALAETDPGTPVLLGETAPGGTAGVEPLVFMRRAACLDDSYEPLPGCPEPERELEADGWAIHAAPPIGVPPFRPSPNPDGTPIASLGEVAETLDLAAAEGALPEELPIYVTSFGIESAPDPAAVSLEAQAAYLSAAELMAYRQPRLRSFAQQLLRDDPVRSIFEVPYAGTESGLLFNNGRRKPSFDAFRLPLVARRNGGEIEIWGLVRPAGGATQVEIQSEDTGGEVRTLRRIQTRPDSTYSFTTEAVPGRRWRSVWLRGGRILRGPWVNALSFELPEPAG